LNRTYEKNGSLSWCRDLGVSAIAYSPPAMGMLSGRYSAENPPRDFRGNRYSLDFLSRLPPFLGLMREIGQGRGGVSTVQEALNRVTGKGAIPIPGVKDKRQAEDIVGPLSWRLTAEEIAPLDSVSDKVGPKP
jgi:pyridoxine 4-dehydrogenase